jgi:molecular chaperone GrpE
MQEKKFQDSKNKPTQDQCAQNESLENENIKNSNLEATQEELNEQQQETDLDDYKAVFERLQQEKEELNSKYLRLAADFQNFRKRVDKEKSDIYEFANEKLILDLLPVVDNFERALQSAKENEQEKAFVKGIEMIFKQFLDVLTKNGVKEISAIGETFDPNYHHAVMQEENSDYESNTITEVFQKGYTFNEKVVRPSMVKVVS